MASSDVVTAPFEVVVIAASAGGVRTLPCLLERLPHDFPVPLIVVQHRSPGPDLLPGLLRRRTPLPVDAAEDADVLAPGVHVLPPRRSIAVAPDGDLTTADADVEYPADESMVRLARDRGLKVCAVVLTGSGRDGARGVRAVKGTGGWVVVQHPEDARMSDMPTAAIATGCADLVLPARIIGPALVTLAMAPGAAPMFYRAPAPWADLTAG